MKVKPLKQACLILAVSSLFLTGCTPFTMSSLTGKGTLSSSDVVFEDKGNHTDETTGNIQTQPEQPVSIPETPPETPQESTENADGMENSADTGETQQPVENKTGNIAYQTYIFRGTEPLPYEGTQVVSTQDEYTSFMEKTASYSNVNNMDASVMDGYFLVAVPVAAASGSWDYSVDSVKNGEMLDITVLCEKPQSSTSDATNILVVVAVSRGEMPVVPDVSGINVKHNSYTVG